jgi:Flp pilus assembly protein TadD
MGGTSAPGEQALAIEPTYALAHGFAAWAHQTIYVRAGMHSENHEKSIRHAHAAIEHGPGDAMALALACFSIGMAEHDRKLADEAFERALALSARAASPPWQRVGSKGILALPGL